MRAPLKSVETRNKIIPSKIKTENKINYIKYQNEVFNSVFVNELIYNRADTNTIITIIVTDSSESQRLGTSFHLEYGGLSRWIQQVC